ncbi:MAG: rhodanese-like domain-containing protein [Candidatus Rokuibacteriota bacterium]
MGLLVARIAGSLLLVALALSLPAPARAGGEEGVAFIAADDLRAQQASGRQITLVDVRTAQEFQDARIKGAVNVPLTELERRFKEIPRQGLVVLY